ncbi:MAG: CGNR zinc finger domain-containing protein [Cryobacterium sp.]|nr:CGNR zinc finger domain-containing protein [Cryobacterium sp.]
MLFAPDTIDSLVFAAALANTHPGASRSGDDELASPRQLTEFLDQQGYRGRFDRDDAELAEVVETRSQIHDLWELRRDDAVPHVNRLLSDASAMPFLVRHDGLDWHVHAVALSAPLAERIRVEVAMGLLDVIRSNEWERLRSCAAEDCTGVFVDLSRNGSKRFCSVRCSNRVNMIEHRARVAQN